MSLLPDSASFHEKVQDAFVAYRGSGVSLSAADLELLDAWAAKEVPFEVVARGLRKAAEAALWDSADGEGKLRSLKGCRKAVEGEIGKYLRQTAGRTAQDAPIEEPFHVTRHKKLVATIKKVTKPNVPGWVERLGVPEDFAQGDRQEHLAIALLCRALPFERRHALLREARASVEKAFVMTAATKRESFKFHRSALVRQAWSMPSLW